ncbi:PP2C family protein-serine/threonine phosphatase [Crocinitomicaceae bacterium]|jgi:sigma-B regulation protein RsbU (phosphoserine phosphatase)|nr:PP2C family protein-serine/threonine phosphatase [Crocinitomicaceae bacterium]MDG1037298.1 PP2C family protein-serine/threonine phosphatase [Crocinitomicaceae bacterium]
MREEILRSLNSQIELKDFKLNSLLDITTAINSNKDVRELTRLFEFIVKEQLGYDKFVLFNKQEEWNCLLRVGFRGKVKNIDVVAELGRFQEITFIESSQSKLLNDFDVIIPVFHNDVALAYLLIEATESDGNNNKVLNYMSFIQTLANIIVVAIENKRMTKVGIRQESLKKELEVASAMQQLLFPSDLPTNTRMDISAMYKPRHEVGGDYYDFIPLGDDEYIICIADVSGKGVSAAMLMANFQATLRTLFQYQRFDMQSLIEELNKKVMNSAKGEKFITFFIAHYDATTRKMNYVNAGHNHPFLTNGTTVIDLDQGTIGLGMLEELPFINVGETQLSPNTTMVLYTDGVVELENESEEFFGSERLVQLVKSYYPLGMDDMNSLIFSKLDEWKGPLELVDDTAIFSCRFY